MLTLYLSGQRWLHRVPAGGKLAVLALASIGLFPVETLHIHLAVLAAVLMIYLSLGAEALAGLRILRPLLVVLALLFLLQGMTDGWRSGGVLVLRMISLVLLANVVSMTTRMDEMMMTLEPLFAPLRPLGLAPRRISFAVALLVRFVPVLLALNRQLTEGWRARGGRRQRWRLVAPMLLNAIRMADHVAEAVTARGGITSTQTTTKKIPPHTLNR